MRTKRPRPRTNSKLSPRRLAAVDRAVRAMELRAAGRTFDEIASALGYSGRQGAYDAVARALDQTVQPVADQVRKLDLERLDALWRVVYVRAMKGSAEHARVAIRVLERRARLLGLDAPTQLNAQIAVGGGVLVVPGPMDEESWQQAAVESQVGLADKERAVWEKPEDAKH